MKEDTWIAKTCILWAVWWTCSRLGTEMEHCLAGHLGMKHLSSTDTWKLWCFFILDVLS